MLVTASERQRAIAAGIYAGRQKHGGAEAERDDGTRRNCCADVARQAANLADTVDNG